MPRMVNLGEKFVSCIFSERPFITPFATILQSSLAETSANHGLPNLFRSVPGLAYPLAQ